MSLAWEEREFARFLLEIVDSVPITSLSTGEAWCVRARTRSAGESGLQPAEVLLRFCKGLRIRATWYGLFLCSVWVVWLLLLFWHPCTHSATSVHPENSGFWTVFVSVVEAKRSEGTERVMTRVRWGEVRVAGGGADRVCLTLGSVSPSDFAVKQREGLPCEPLEPLEPPPPPPGWIILLFNFTLLGELLLNRG